MQRVRVPLERLVMFEALLSERFRIVSRMGEGAYGTVYEAMDLVREERVAIKVLHRFGGDALFRFKHEFRSLREVRHPNLVELGELIERNGRWMFTMELVVGSDWLAYVRPRRSQRASTGALDAPSRSLDEERLRDSLRQLASGLVALHRAGKVHRDIKPPNVRVDDGGRVVLLDFGLVTESDEESGSAAASMVGTAAYMSPEQAGSLPATPASDWYSVGVLLYEALTGRRPFTGPALQILFDKQSQAPARPSVLAEDVPADLEALCMALLRVDPAARPSGEDVLRQLGLSGSGGALIAAGPLFGRTRELERLQAAVDDLNDRGVTSHLYIAAEPGMGKTRLLAEWMRGVQQHHPNVLLLRGGGLEAESVPFRAVDGVVDALSHALRQRPDVDLPGDSEEGYGALCTVFPVLGRVASIEESLSGYESPLDPWVERTEAFDALRGLLRGLSRQRTLLVVIDDLDDADTESLELLEHLVDHPDAPRMLIVAAGAPLSQCGMAVRRLVEGILCPADGAVMELAGLPVEESEELARSLLAAEPLAWAALPLPDRARQIARRAEGHPLFIRFLVRHGAELTSRNGQVPTLTEALRHQVTALGPDARELLALLAVSDEALTLEVLRLAAQLSGSKFSAAMAALLESTLLSERGAGEHAALAITHARLRQTMLNQLDADARHRCHRALAEAYLQLEGQDAEALALHLEAAGEAERAAHFAVIAAGAAMDAYAFERAARLFALALRLSTDKRRRRRLWIRYADALVGNGQSEQAAAAYLEAIPGAEPMEAAELRTLAAQQRMHSGDVADGLRHVRGMLRTLGYSYPKSRAAALSSFLYQRARLRLRGTRFELRGATWIAPERLHEVDLLCGAANMVTMADVIRGADLQTRHLLLALETGEPYRLSRALALEAQFLQSTLPRLEPRATELFAQSRLLAEESGNPHAHAIVSLCEGGAAHSVGRFGQALAKLDEAERILRRRCRGVTWELDLCHYMAAISLMYMGRFRKLRACFHVWRADARERGDQYLECLLDMTGGYWIPLLAGDLAGARALLESSVARWRAAEFHSAAVLECVAATYIALHSDPENARAIFLRTSSGVDAQTVARVPSLRVLLRTLRAQSALATGARGDRAARKTACAKGRGAAAVLSRELLGYGPAFGALLAAAVATQEGQSMRAVSLLNEAAAGFQAHEMGLYAAASRYREGQLIGGQQGGEQVSRALQWAQEFGVGDPVALLEAASPGFAPG